MTVMFCGHSEIHDESSVGSWLQAVTQTSVFAECRRIYLGGYGQFDRMAASAVRRLKEEDASIESVLVQAYLHVVDDCGLYDDYLYPQLEDVPARFAIVYRNRWMVDNSDMVVAYVTHKWGGAAATLEYARKQHKTIIKYPDITPL